MSAGNMLLVMFRVRIGTDVAPAMCKRSFDADGSKRDVRGVAPLGVVIARAASSRQECGAAMFGSEKKRTESTKERLLREIQAESMAVGLGSEGGAIDARVLQAIADVPREEFVPSGTEPEAYANVPLPIGHGQTISQPFVVAFMTDMLRLDADDVVLEVGTGSGYQAAVLARLVRFVYSIEIIEPLALQARLRLERLGYRNVEVRHGDGYSGWQEHAPFDGIIVTAAAIDVPPPLVEQLKFGARMILPVTSSWPGQDLLLVEKDGSGKVTQKTVLPVAFVPLTRMKAW
jgi:protein-L-isoaspartate(D-aspartate) O-methyltransferase